MPQTIDPARLDVAAFARAAGRAHGQWRLGELDRLGAQGPLEVQQRPVDWQADGQLRTSATGAAEIWLHLRARAQVPQVCQRCLEPVDVPLSVQRSFRFVPDEATAEAQDEHCEEDVLVLTRALDLRSLAEDELLLALPLIARHEVCPGPVIDQVADAAFGDAGSAASPARPFAVLEGMRHKLAGKS